MAKAKFSPKTNTKVKRPYVRKPKSPVKKTMPEKKLPLLHRLKRKLSRA